MNWKQTLGMLGAIALLATPAAAQKQYDSGATDKSIKIGNVTPYTGSYSEYGVEGRAEASYFQMINDRGGINGRKIEFISEDDASSTRQGISLAHRLIDQDHVLLLFSTFGAPTSLAMRDYCDQQKVPQLFVQTSSAAFDEPSRHPWTMGFFATYRTEGTAYAKYVLATRPQAKIAILYADTEAGREYRDALHEGLGAAATRMIVKEASFQPTSPEFDAKLGELKASGADVFFNVAWGRYATETIRGAYDLGWHPLQFIPNASLSVAAFLEPAGLEKATGIICNARSKGWWRESARRDPAVAEFLEWMHKYNPQASLRDQIWVAGYTRAQVLVEVLRKCGDDLTRANVMKQAARLDFQPSMLWPGIHVTTSPTDYQPIKELFLVKFDGKAWVPLDRVISP